MQYICKKTKMSILVVGTVAFDAIETKHGKTVIARIAPSSEDPKLCLQP